MFKFLKQNRGDTIVEVLIAIVVLSSVLAGAYQLTSDSTHIERSTQEHSEALSLAQSQIEALRTTSLGVGSCFTNQDTPANGAACSFSSNWSTCISPPAPYCYNVTVSPPAVGTIPPTYTIAVKWTGPDGQPAQVQLYYQWFGN